MEQHREKKRDLHMVFIDIEKACDKVSRKVFGDAWRLEVYQFGDAWRLKVYQWLTFGR